VASRLVQRHWRSDITIMCGSSSFLPLATALSVRLAGNRRSSCTTNPRHGDSGSHPHEHQHCRSAAGTDGGISPTITTTSGRTPLPASACVEPTPQ